MKRSLIGIAAAGCVSLAGLAQNASAQSCEAGTFEGAFAGEVVVAREVRDARGVAPDPDPSAVDRLGRLAGVVPGTVWSDRDILCRAREKRAAWEALDSPETAVVDLETAACAGAAAEHGVPYVVLRAVCDAAGEDLPLDLNGCRGNDGAVSRFKVARRALLRPASIGGLWELETQHLRLLEKGPLRSLVFRKARQGVGARTRGNYPAPPFIIDCVEAGYSRGMRAGQQRESELFGKLTAGPVSKNLIGLFEATNELKKPMEGVEPRPVGRLGVLGGGFMGSGIAAVSVGLATANDPAFGVIALLLAVLAISAAAERYSAHTIVLVYASGFIKFDSVCDFAKIIIGYDNFAA